MNYPQTTWTCARLALIIFACFLQNAYGCHDDFYHSIEARSEKQPNHLDAHWGLSTRIRHHGDGLLGYQQNASSSNIEQKRSDDTDMDKPPKSAQIPLSGPVIESFSTFSKTVSVSAKDGFLFVESNAMPLHGMMVGIRSWQQQVPLPQPFFGENAWRLPLKPKFSDQPISVLKEPLRGAIALAVNGVPIFCALNNRGDDTFLAGELDNWGGHCGRGDDYHYHIAPVHLEEKVGVGNPTAYALDGFPILGFTEADGTIPTDLDKFNGHEDPNGNYHYHATKDFPYVNGGLRGAVELDGDQIVQPRDLPYRPAQSPLPGATIEEFHRDGNQFDLRYVVDGNTGSVKYSIIDDERVEFTYTPPSRIPSTVVYQRGKVGMGLTLRALAWAIPLFIGLLVATFMIVKRRKRVRINENVRS